ncbi:MAG: hypothetical protein GY943_20725, partial [Chloroflexi bacterium]|nr:hypothetical protein [Chloroflexota bacterium]
VLAKYYDVLFYIANWGSVQLAFRFPKGLIDVDAIRPYCVDDHLTCDTVDDHVIINFEWNEEGGFDYWVEGEGTLADLLPLREAILRQDYRVLYLAWLMATENEYEVSEDDLEPPVPPGLAKLSASLQAFVDTFSIDENMIAAAATASPPARQIASFDMKKVIKQLSVDDQQAWLTRLANDEIRLGSKFQRFLQEKLPKKVETAVSSSRTVAELRQIAEVEEQKEANRLKAVAAANHKKRMEALAPKSEETWTFVQQLIEQGNSRAYDEATGLLVQLQDLAVYQGTEATFTTRISYIREKYPRRKALLRRLDRAGLN